MVLEEEPESTLDPGLFDFSLDSVFLLLVELVSPEFLFSFVLVLSVPNDSSAWMRSFSTDPFGEGR